MSKQTLLDSIVSGFGGMIALAVGSWFYLTVAFVAYSGISAGLAYVLGTPWAIAACILGALLTLFGAMGFGASAWQAHSHAGIGYLLACALLCVICFACVFRTVYWYRPQWYAFSEMIREGKFNEQLRSTTQDSRTAGTIVICLAQLDRWLVQNGQVPIESDMNMFIAPTVQFERRYRQPAGEYDNGVSEHAFVIDDEGKKTRLTVEQAFDTNEAPTSLIAKLEYQGTQPALRKTIEKLQAAIGKEQDRKFAILMKLQRGDAEFGFVDFLYLSGSTFTTVGAGDILPNSTFVRFLVVLEASLSILMLGVAVEVVMTARPPNGTAAPATPPVQSPAVQSGAADDAMSVGASESGRLGETGT